MKTVLTLARLGLIIAITAVVAVLLWKFDGKGCEKGGPGCRCCSFPCEYNRTGEKSSEK